MTTETLLEAWRSIPTEFSSGLTETELQRAEGTFALQFPEDLRFLLANAMPLGEKFPDWKKPQSVEKQFSWPWHGIVFDIEHNSVWPTAWGSRPEKLKDQLSRARQWFETAPKLIPLVGHRYIAATPTSSGNPILSVYQTDIVYYGANLADWIRTEFHGHPLEQLGAPDEVPGWSNAMHWRDEDD